MFKCLNMPKKTKKQKIAAAKRKHTIFLQSEVNNFQVVTPSIEVGKTEIKEIKKVQKPIIDQKEVSEFRKDLFKSLILTFIILSVTVGLYFVRENHFITFF